MLSLLRNYPGYTSALAFRPKPSVLRVATRHFLTTSLVYSPAQKKENAKAEVSTVNGALGTELNKNSAALEKEKPAKPKKLTKKDLTPPVKRPAGSFVNFIQEYRTKHQQDTNSSTPFNLKTVIQDAAVEWRRLSEAEKQSYASSPEQFEAYKLAYQKWKDGLSVETKRVLKLRKRREKGSGYSLFLSETWRQGQGDTFTEKMRDRNTAWNLLTTEQKEDYMKRSATPFGVFLRRAKQHERLLLRKEKDKAKMEARKQREKTWKAAQKEKERIKKEKVKRTLKAKKEKELKDMKEKKEKALKEKEKAKAKKEKALKEMKAKKERALKEKAKEKALERAKKAAKQAKPKTAVAKL